MPLIGGIVTGVNSFRVTPYNEWCPFSLVFLPIYEKQAKDRDSKFIQILLDGAVSA